MPNTRTEGEGEDGGTDKIQYLKKSLIFPASNKREHDIT
jgi:hypothetical protein